MRATLGLLTSSLCLAFALGCGLVAQGCNQSSAGGVTGANQRANFNATNRASETVEWYVDGASVGKVQPNASVDFTILSGTRQVQVREKGEVLRLDQGVFDFRDDNLVQLSYDPSGSVNLRVRNTSPETVHVIVGAVDVGSVSAGGTRDFAVPSGSLEVFLRLDSQGSGTLKGTFNLNSSALVELSAP